MDERKTVEQNVKQTDAISKATADRGQSSSPETVSAEQVTKPIGELSADEQMALYEKELKENDWGHQPC